MREEAKKILETLTRKGWGLYERVATPRNLERILTGGNAETLEEGVIYEIWPLAISRKSEGEALPFLKRVTAPGIYAPSDMMVPGRVVAQFGEEPAADYEERQIYPGEPLAFQGIELLEREVRLIRPERTYMSYDVFIQAIESLEDISSLAA